MSNPTDALVEWLDDSEHARDCPSYLPIGTRDSFMCNCGLTAARAEANRLREKAAMADELAAWIKRDEPELFPRENWMIRYDAITERKEEG